MLTTMLLGACFVALLLPAASAGTYTNGGRHYQFDYPDTWTSGPSPGTDAVYEGPDANGTAPSVTADSGNDNNAADNASWIFAQANASLATLNSSMTLTIVQGVRSFTTASGRVAADFVIEQNASGVTLRERHVRFASDFQHSWYELTLADNASTYDSHSTNWTQIVDSFRVTGEPQIPADLTITVAGNATNVLINASVSYRFAVNVTLPAGLVIEWFNNGTSVGTGDHVDLTFPNGTAVISVTISNATATRTLTKTVGTGTTPPAQQPPPGGQPYTTDSGYLTIVGILVILVVVAGLGYYVMVVRPKQQQQPKPPQGNEPPKM